MSRVFHESYGDVTPAQLRCYRQFNISPMDHDDLIRLCGDDPDRIIAFIKRHPEHTAYRVQQALVGRGLA